MIRFNKETQPMSQNQIARQRLCLTADKTALVDAADVRAAFLFATPGDEILPEVAEQFGLIDGALPDFDQAAADAEAAERAAEIEAAEKAAAELDAQHKAAAEKAEAETKAAAEAAAKAQAAAAEKAAAQTSAKPRKPAETKPKPAAETKGT